MSRTKLPENKPVKQKFRFNTVLIIQDTVAELDYFTILLLSCTHDSNIKHGNHLFQFLTQSIISLQGSSPYLGERSRIAGSEETK
jgi:hypothetical protein